MRSSKHVMSAGRCTYGPTYSDSLNNLESIDLRDMRRISLILVIYIRRVAPLDWLVCMEHVKRLCYQGCLTVAAHAP